MIASTDTARETPTGDPTRAHHTPPTTINQQTTAPTIDAPFLFTRAARLPRLRRAAVAGQRWVDSPPHRSSEHTPRPIVGLDGAADTAVLKG